MKKADLEMFLAESERNRAGLAEWFHLTTRTKTTCGEYTCTVDAPDIGEVYTVRVIGTERPHGGVVTVTNAAGNTSDPEFFFGSLTDRWHRSGSPYLKNAAFSISRALQALAVKP